MGLIDQSVLESSVSVPGWHNVVMQSLAERLSEPSDFPCLFSLKSFSRKLIKFAFVEDLSEASLDALAEDLYEFVALSKGWDGNVSTAHPLIVAFSLGATEGCTSLEAYHALGWRILQTLHERDRVAWPEGIPRDPHDAYWSWCFGGMQLFVNMSAPAYTRRKSRNLGPHFMFVVNPRERFDVVAGNDATGHRLREVVRERIDTYDNYPYSHQLGHYQSGEIEWWQYSLSDVNEERYDKCPFHVKEEA